ncbi:MAG: GNAT family N-acetyltransferase [Myxococcaceae bacterium]
MATHVRPATRADVGHIFRFICELADYEKLRHEVRTSEAALEAQLFGARPAAEVLMGELDGVPRGFALFFHNFSTFEGKPGLYLEDLYVEPASRGSGLGKALLVALSRLAVDRGCARFEWSVLDWNEPALAFYRSIGARPMNEWTVQRLDGDALQKLAGR